MTGTIAAPATVPAMDSGHILGPLSLSSVALVCAIVMILGLRKSDRLKFLHRRDGAASWAVFTGSVWMAAGSSWASTAVGIASVPTSVLGSGGGNLTAGGTALALTVLAYFASWKHMVIPTVLGIAAAVTYASAGGAWGVIVNSIRMVVAHFAGSA